MAQIRTMVSNQIAIMYKTRPRQFAWTKHETRQQTNIEIYDTGVKEDHRDRGEYRTRHISYNRMVCNESVDCGGGRVCVEAAVATTPLSDDYDVCDT